MPDAARPARRARPLRSIRATLLFWYCAILMAVVSGFGGLLFYTTRRAALDEFDGQLETRARGIAAALARPADAGQPWQLPEELRRDFDRPKPRPKPKPQEARPETDEHDEDAGERNRPGDRPYYVIWDAGGTVVDASHPHWAVPPPEPRPPGHDPQKPRRRYRDGWREVAVAAPGGSLVLVGRSAEELQRRVGGFLVRLAVIGGGAVALALAGGWFLAGRTLAPIDEITRTAEAISASDLSRRISLSETETELGRLAAVLNTAFDRLEAAVHRQAAFTADASHELRTPLAVVIAQAEHALRRERPADQYRQTLQSMLDAARRMQSIVEGLLTLARADAGEYDLRREAVHLAAIVEEALDSLAPLAATREVSLHFSGDRDVSFQGDAQRLRQLAINLVHNAIRYNRPGGRVDLSLAVEPEGVELRVADTGIGIPAESIARVFERFFRVDAARARENGGCGLGLAICKWIAEAHGGSIRCESRPGEGSLFTVTLPRPASS